MEGLYRCAEELPSAFFPAQTRECGRPSVHLSFHILICINCRGRVVLSRQGPLCAAPLLHPGRIGTESTRCNIQLPRVAFHAFIVCTHIHTTNLHWVSTVHPPAPPCQQE